MHFDEKKRSSFVKIAECVLVQFTAWECIGSMQFRGAKRARAFTANSRKQTIRESIGKTVEPFADCRKSKLNCCKMKMQFSENYIGRKSKNWKNAIRLLGAFCCKRCAEGFPLLVARRSLPPRESEMRFGVPQTAIELPPLEILLHLWYNGR